MPISAGPRAHDSPRTTKLYELRGNEITLEEIERIAN